MYCSAEQQKDLGESVPSCVGVGGSLSKHAYSLSLLLPFSPLVLPSFPHPYLSSSFLLPLSPSSIFQSLYPSISAPPPSLLLYLHPLSSYPCTLHLCSPFPSPISLSSILPSLYPSISAPPLPHLLSPSFTVISADVH